MFKKAQHPEGPSLVFLKDISASAIRSLGVAGFVTVGALVSGDTGGCQGSADEGIAKQGPGVANVSEHGSAIPVAHFRWQPELLGPLCALFARKFPSSTAEAVRKLDTVGEAAENRIVVGQADDAHVRTR